MEILFQDPSILVINKPAGIPVLPDGWEKDAPYLLKLLEEEFGKLWVVHRLDKVTSGVHALRPHSCRSPDPQYTVRAS